jgi:uncharacterized membrane protein YqjE
VFTLRSVSQLAPVLLQHLGAYAELAGEDLARSRTEIGRAAGGVVMLLASLLFALEMLCLAAVAAAWDTPARMPVIYSLLGLFTILAAGAAIHLRRLQRARAPLFSAVRREWEIDRQALSLLFSGGAGGGAGPEITTVNQGAADESVA